MNCDRTLYCYHFAFKKVLRMDVLYVNAFLNSHGLLPSLSQYWSLARTLLILNIIPTTTIASTGTQTEQMTFPSLLLVAQFSLLFSLLAVVGEII